MEKTPFRMEISCRDARDEKRYHARSPGSSPKEAGAIASKIAMEGRVEDAADQTAAAHTPVQIE